MPLQEVKLKAKSDAPSKSGLENVEPDVLEKAMDDAMRKEGSELDLSEEEHKNFKKAFQDKEFRKMMAEYVDEISDPKHRAEQDAYIREMEAKGETPKDKKVVHPNAGFVVKTKKEKDGSKLFLNIVSSVEVAQPTSTSVKGGDQWQLPHLLGPPRMERDKKDNSVGAFDCCFHPLALAHAERARPFRDLLVSTAIDAVEKSYAQQKQACKLSRTYHVLLGVTYKTGPPQALMVAHDAFASKTTAKKKKPKKKKKKKKKKEVAGPSFADNIRGSLKSIPKPAPAPVLGDQRDRAQKLLAKAQARGEAEAASRMRRGESGDQAGPRTVPKTQRDPLDAPCTIKERGAFDLQKFRIGAGSEADRRPKELSIEVSLQMCETAKGLDLELDGASFRLKMVLDAVTLYDVKRTLPYPVNGTKGSAKFDRRRRTLTVVAPVLPRTNEEVEREHAMHREPTSSVSVIGGSVPEVSREHTTAHGQRRRERVVEPRETLTAKDKRLSKAPDRAKRSDDHARFLEKRAVASRMTPRPPDRVKYDERGAKLENKKTWSESESEEDDDEDAAPDINASIAEDNVAAARKAAAGFKAAPEVIDGSFAASAVFDGSRSGFVFTRGPKGVGYYQDTSTTFLPTIEARQKERTATVIIDAAGVGKVDVSVEGSEARVTLDERTFGLRLGGAVHPECRTDAADANVVLVFTKSEEAAWTTVAEAFAVDAPVAAPDEAATESDEDAPSEPPPPSLTSRGAPNDAPPPPPPATTFAAPEFQNTLLYNID